MIDALEAVEEHAADVAIDPVVSADFDEGVIAMRFQISVVDLADVPYRDAVRLRGDLDGRPPLARERECGPHRRG